MSKDSYNDIDELFKDLINDIENKISEEVSNEMKKIEQESIDKNVYGVFTPKEYVRRKDNDGLRSENNMDVTVTKNGDGVTIEVHNSTTGNILYRNYYRGEIQDLILEGRYMWNGSMPPPRDFITPAQEEIDNSERINEAIERALKKLGW